MKASIKTTRPFPARSLQSFVRPTPVGGLVAIVLVFLVLATALWQLRGVPVSAPQPYQAPVLDLTTSGALALNLSLTDLNTLSESSFSPSAFRFVVNDAPVAFALEFEGAGEASIYDLSGGTYPLTLSLLDGGQAYHTFTASEGSVTFANGEVTVSAFLSDEGGQQLFLSSRFVAPEIAPEPVQACSESYRFCFSGL